MERAMQGMEFLKL